MQLLIKNPIFTKKTTISELYIDGVFECHILEDVVRKTGQVKIWGETAIPSGTYKVSITEMSPRFGKVLPRLKNVPGFEGVLIHPGNKASDTHGCLLPGNYYKVNPDWVSNSKMCFDKLFAKLKTAKHEITITIQR